MVVLFEGELMMMLREAERAPVQTKCSGQSVGEPIGRDLAVVGEHQNLNLHCIKEHIEGTVSDGLDG